MRGKVARQRRVVLRFLRAFIAEARAILKRASPGFYKRFPNAGRPCHTCAFNPGTDSWTGFEKTVFGLMQCLRDDRPFYCHEGIPWTKELSEWTPAEIAHFKEHAKLCSGYAVIVGEPDAKLAVGRAARSCKGQLA